MSIQPPKISHDPIYDRFFPQDGVCNENWNEFRRYEAFPKGPLTPDLVIETRKVSWVETAKAIVIIVLKIILFPWGIYDGLKHLARILGMGAVYPAHAYGKYFVHSYRYDMEKLLQAQKSLVVRDLVIQEDGVQYSGLIVGKPKTLSNGKWVLFAVGNAGTIENAFVQRVHQFCLKAGFNLVMINGPSVGLSEGRAIPKNIGHVQKLGLDLLKNQIKAKKVVLAGHSLGGGAVGEATNQYTFDTESTQYFVIRMMTFSKLSKIIKELGGTFADWVRWWLDYEINSVAASQKLERLGIPELIVTAEDDEVMDKVHLRDAVQKVCNHKTYLNVRGAKFPHMGIPRDLIAQAIMNWDKNPDSNNYLPDVEGTVELDEFDCPIPPLVNQEKVS